MGVLALIGFRPLASAIDASRPLVLTAGGAAMLWAGLVWVLSRVPSWRPATALVVVANLAAVAALAVTLLATDASDGRTVVLGIVAAQVFVFAAVQAHALWSPFGR
jgi:hypothetical protein